MSLPSRTDVVVVGAGAAGLAVSACLTRAAIPHALLEREDAVAAAWRGHYDRLHLHTDRAHSGLPFLPMPRSYPRYPSRDQVIEYLERYVRELGLRPVCSTPAESVRPENGGWITEVPGTTVRSRAVVVSTGYTGRTVRPTWPGLEGFPGRVLHSSEYRSGRSFAGQDVLVVGFGNSGGEIALDLLEHGARPTLSVRGPVNVVPRDVLGVPILSISIPLSKLPPKLADLLSCPLLRLHYPSYRRLGLRKAPYGPFEQIARHGRIPLLDIGTIKEVRQGNLRVRDDVVGFRGPKVTFATGAEVRIDALVLATGFRPEVTSFLSTPVPVTDQEGIPLTSGRESGTAGLYFCGFYVAPTGMLREVGIEARRIVRHIDSARQGPKGFVGH